METMRKEFKQIKKCLTRFQWRRHHLVFALVGSVAKEKETISRALQSVTIHTFIIYESSQVLRMKRHVCISISQIQSFMVTLQRSSSVTNFRCSQLNFVKFFDINRNSFLLLAQFFFCCIENAGFLVGPAHRLSSGNTQCVLCDFGASMYS